jgi:hypothetical protein
MTNTSTQVLAASSGPWAQVRTGTIAAATLGSATVVVGGTSFEASYVLPFGVLPSPASLPQVGDLVSVVRQDASWQILGRIAGAGPNLITNGSFEAGAPSSFPEDWTLYNITSTSTATVTDTVAVDGGRSALVLANSAVTAESYLYSSPVPVVAGDIMSLSAYAGAAFGDETPVSVNAGLYALWFATDTDVYPTTSSADSLIASATAVAQAPPFTPLSGTVTAPVSGYMRLALRSTVASTTGLVWDFAVVRRNEN